MPQKRCRYGQEQFVQVLMHGGELGAIAIVKAMEGHERLLLREGA